MTYCEDYPCCGHTYDDPCGRQPYDEPGYYDTSRPGNEHALCNHAEGECDVEDYYDDEPECDEDHECDSCNGPAGVWDRDGNFIPHPGAVWHCSWCERPCPAGAHD